MGKHHHLLPDGETSYSIEDFFYAAGQFGLVRELFWVAPPHVEIENAEDVMMQLSELDGVTPECLSGFQSFSALGHLCTRGRVLGVELTVCRRQSLNAK